MTKAEMIRAIVERHDYRYTHDELLLMRKNEIEKVYHESKSARQSN